MYGVLRQLCFAEAPLRDVGVTCTAVQGPLGSDGDSALAKAHE